MLILAQVMRGGIGQMAIYVVIVAAICALVFIALRQLGVAIPTWVAQCFWVIVVAVVVVAAIRFLMTI